MTGCLDWKAGKPLDRINVPFTHYVPLTIPFDIRSKSSTRLLVFTRPAPSATFVLLGTTRSPVATQCRCAEAFPRAEHIGVAVSVGAQAEAILIHELFNSEKK
eukprot:9222051-Pyramimonas_sp.AAC.1